MEKLEFYKNLERKKAFLSGVMILSALLIPTLLSIFKEIGLPWFMQVVCYLSLISLIIFCHFRSLDIAARIK